MNEPSSTRPCWPRPAAAVWVEAHLSQLESDFLRSAEVERVDSAAPSPPGPDLAASSARPMIEAYVHAIVDTCTRPREEIVAR